MSNTNNSSIKRFLTKNKVLDVTPSREQGPPKRVHKWSEVVLSQGKTSDELEPPIIDPPHTITAEPPTVVQTSNPSSKKNTSKEAVSEDEDDDEDEEETIPLSLFPPPQDSYKNLQAFSGRFIVNMDLTFSTDPKMILIETARWINKGLVYMKQFLQFRGVPGKLVLLPWADDYVYQNRAVHRLRLKESHETLLAQIQALLWNYGGPFGKKNDTGTIKKYTRIHVAILNEEPLTENHHLIAQQLYKTDVPSHHPFSILKCASQAISPTIVVQFRQSFCRNPTNWKDKGQEDCLSELDAMIAQQLPPYISAGLKRANLATGNPYMKNDPNLLSLECDAKYEKEVTRDMLRIFKATNRKDQVKAQCTVPWIAVPYFKGQDMQGDKRFIPEYMEIKAKERTYQEDIAMRYIVDILRLDDIAPDSMHLSKEMLKQLENSIWDQGETPVRALIYDKLWDDTKESLKNEWLDKKKKVSPITEEWAKKADTAISIPQILQRMSSMGYDTLAPYDSNSFPIPSPSKRTLREYLMSIKSRRHAELKTAAYVFESINKTDDGRVLFSYLNQNADEACTILENLPLFIQHEMNLEPSFFLSPTLLRTCQGNYYNPLTRTGITAVAQSLTDKQNVEVNPRLRIPRGIRTASASQLEEIFKRKEHNMFSFPDDEDLHSLAASVSSYKVVTEKSVREIEAVMNLQTLLTTHHLYNNSKEDISVLSDGSNFSFDSQASRARYEIEKRAEAKVQEALKRSKLQQGVTLHRLGQLSHEVADALGINIQEVIQYWNTSEEYKDSKVIDLTEANRNKRKPKNKAKSQPSISHQVPEQPTVDNVDILGSSQLPVDLQNDGDMDMYNSPEDNHLYFATADKEDDMDMYNSAEDNHLHVATADNKDDKNDNMSTGSDSTQPTGSPSKQAPDGLDIGTLK